MNRKYRFVSVLLISWLILGIVIYSSPGAEVAAASWGINCTGVLGSERGLWLDSAGPGGNNEGGYFWIKNNDAGNETCTAQSSINPAISSSKFPKLKVRAAVNDGAKFKVQVYEYGVSEFCETLVATIAWSATEDHSGFLTKEITLPAGKEICLVTMTLDDDPDTIKSWRTNALVDDIRIWNGSTVGWKETFSGGAP